MHHYKRVHPLKAAADELEVEPEPELSIILDRSAVAVLVLVCELLVAVEPAESQRQGKQQQ